MNSLRRSKLEWLLCGLLVACGSRNMEPVDAGSGRRCSVNSECDDSIECTVDTCGPDMFCAYTPVDAICTGDGESCVVGVGCTSAVSCTTNAECDDDLDCTVDTCGAGRTCEHTAVNALCTDPMMPTCEVGRGCVAGSMRCTSSAQCDDMVACTVDVCAAGGMCQNTPVDSMCDTAAGEVCTSAGCMVPMTCTTADECQDGNFCNGMETCRPEFGCSPATMMPRCDDGDPCTVDSCDPAVGCQYVCNPSMAGCSCGGEIDCTGRFMVVPAPSDTCASGMVDYQLGQIAVTIAAGQAFIDPDGSSRASFGTMTDATASCPRVTAEARVEGMIPEIFSFDVTFETSDRFTGTFNASYGGFGVIAGCREGPISVTGTRIP